MYMRIAFLIILTFFATAAIADDAAYPWPDLRKSGKSVEDFLPKGWRIEMKAEGDLDGDGKADVFVVFRDQDPQAFIKNEGCDECTIFDNNERILAYLIADANGYHLGGSNHEMIPAKGEDANDAFDGVVAGGIEIIEGQAVITAGNFGSSLEQIYANFAWVKDGLYLVGISYSSLHRMTHESREDYYDYLEGKARYLEMDSDEKITSKSEETLEKKPLIRFDDMGMLYEFDGKTQKQY